DVVAGGAAGPGGVPVDREANVPGPSGRTGTWPTVAPRPGREVRPMPSCRHRSPRPGKKSGKVPPRRRMILVEGARSLSRLPSFLCGLAAAHLNPPAPATDPPTRGEVYCIGTAPDGRSCTVALQPRRGRRPGITRARLRDLEGAASHRKLLAPLP